jgi:hypothetical protein
MDEKPTAREFHRANVFFRERQLRFAPDAWRPAPLTAPDLEQPESTLLAAAGSDN